LLDVFGRGKPSPVGAEFVKLLYDLGGNKKDGYGTTNTGTLPLTRTSDV
jgi:hypothetical protein